MLTYSNTFTPNIKVTDTGRAYGPSLPINSPIHVGIADSPQVEAMIKSVVVEESLNYQTIQKLNNIELL